MKIKIKNLKNNKKIFFRIPCKNDGEKCSRKCYFEILRAPLELLLPSPKKLAKKGGLAWPVSRNYEEGQNRNFLTTFHCHF